MPPRIKRTSICLEDYSLDLFSASIHLVSFVDAALPVPWEKSPSSFLFILNIIQCPVVCEATAAPCRRSISRLHRCRTFQRRLPIHIPYDQTLIFLVLCVLVFLESPLRLLTPLIGIPPRCLAFTLGIPSVSPNTFIIVSFGFYTLLPFFLNYRDCCVAQGQPDADGI